MYHYRGAGLDNVYLKNGYREVMYGDEKAVSVENVEGLHQAIAAVLIEKPAPLTGQEFRFLRVEMELSQLALGKLIRVSDQTVAAWEKEVTKKVSGSAELLVRAFALERLLHREGHISDFIEMLAGLDRKITKQFCFKETAEGWKEAA
jgi:putative transcriptional regulator